MPENIELLELWRLCANQIRVGVSGCIGIDLPAFLSSARCLGMEVGEVELRKLRLLECALLESLAEGKDNGR
jgi:hypothetical protein